MFKNKKIGCSLFKCVIKINVLKKNSSQYIN